MSPLQALPTQSVLHPAGVQAARIYGLWEFLLITATVVFLLVVGAAWYAVVHRRRERPEAEAHRVMSRWVGGAIIASLVVLFTFLVVDFKHGRVLASPPPAAEALTIAVKGHQWWWEVEYPNDSAPQRRVITANEIHVPVGRPVELQLTSSDVIHSFWVPNLHGKKDLIPGHQAVTWFRADRPGIYEGQCAELCGRQHALMRLVVVAESPAEFAAWYERQLQPAAPPTDSGAVLGQQVFTTRSCMLCHTVAGTTAGGRVGPDLTHLAGRRMLGAGTLTNTRGNLAGWVVNPRAIKPGVRMPANLLPPGELHALLDYLETLR